MTRLRPHPLAPGLASGLFRTAPCHDSRRCEPPPTGVCERWGGGLGDGLTEGGRRRTGDRPGDMLATHRGLARWRLSGRRRNDTGDRERQPRAVCEARGGRYKCSTAATNVHLDICSTAATNVHLAALAVALYYPWKGPILLGLCVKVASADCIVIVVLELIIA